MKKKKSSAAGVKYDGHKERWDLLPFQVVGEVVKVLTVGAVKYAPDNWKYVPEGPRRYFAACIRHMTAWQSGEKMDKETGLSHLAHAICCLVFMLWWELNGTPEDRGKK